MRTKEWIREWRGNYRLARFPYYAESQWVLWSLCSRDRSEKVQGVYSHETALSLHDMTDIMPTKINLTVPETFRRSSIAPKDLILHRRKVSKADRDARQGHEVTRSLRTLLDVLAEGKKGLITYLELHKRLELEDLLPSPSQL